MEMQPPPLEPPTDVAAFTAATSTRRVHDVQQAHEEPTDRWKIVETTAPLSFGSCLALACLRPGTKVTVGLVLIAACFALLAVQLGLDLRIEGAKQRRLEPAKTYKNIKKMLKRVHKKTKESPQLYLRHMSKAGGTYIQHVLGVGLKKPVVARGHLTYVQDLYFRSPKFDMGKIGGDGFIIGTMRNPCDYYLSLAKHAPYWPYDSAMTRKAWRYTAPLVPVTGHRAGFDGFDPPKDFDTIFPRWLRALVDKGSGLGWMSFFFWAHYRFHGAMLTPTEIAQDLLKAPRRPVDCWVFTISIESDLRRCLEQFAKKFGAGYVDFAKFDELAEKAKKTSFQCYHDCDKKALPGPSAESKCHRIFQTNGLGEMVLKADAPLFRMFNISSCCNE